METILPKVSVDTPMPNVEEPRKREAQEVKTRKIGVVDVVIDEKELRHNSKSTGMNDCMLILEKYNPKIYVVEWLTVGNADRGWEVVAVFSVRSEAEEFKKAADADESIITGSVLIQHLRMSTVIDMIANCKMMGVPAKIDELLALHGNK